MTSSSSSTPAAPPSWRSARGSGISQRVLVACAAFGPRLSAATVTGALAVGLADGGLPETDLCPLPETDPCPLPGVSEHGGDVRALLDALDFDALMRAARAVVLGAWRLEEDALAGSATFEIATRARQSGVPAYAVAGESALDAFDARILDLQQIVQARSRTGLQGAGRRLAALI